MNPKDTDIIDKFFNNEIICNIPDFSLGIFSKNCVKKLINKYHNLDNIIDIFKQKYHSIDNYQILFGIIINNAGIYLHDMQDKYQSMFYETPRNANIGYIKILNYNRDKNNLLLPIFVPIDILIMDFSFDILTEGIKQKNEFIEKFNFIKRIKR